MTDEHSGQDGALIGSAIAAVAGTAWLLWAASQLPAAPAVLLAVAAVAAGLNLLAALLHRRRLLPASGRTGGDFGPGYRRVVAGEVVALFGGSLVLNTALDEHDGNAGWVALVVGVHFVVLARVWHEPLFTALGIAISAFGLVGLVAALAGASLTTATLLAALPTGIALLLSGYGGLRRGAPRPQAR